MRRQQVLLLYRRILQAIRQVPNDSDRKYLKDWAREEFKRNKSATEEVRPRSLVREDPDPFVLIRLFFFKFIRYLGISTEIPPGSSVHGILQARTLV